MAEPELRGVSALKAVATAPLILILGARGQVGHDCCTALANLGTVIALDRSQCDASDLAAVQAALDTHAPHVIVNAAAHTAVDKAESEPELAYTLNAKLPALLAEYAKRTRAYLLHYSTDYVFDGKKVGAYTELDTPNPQGVYGASKWAGEQAIMASGAAASILRLSWVFGAGRDLSANNFPKTMLRLAKDRDALRVVADQRGTPTPSATVAAVSKALIERWLKAPNTQTPACELFHLSGGGAHAATSWHSLAQETLIQATRLGIGLLCAPSGVAAITTADYPTPASRPANSVMDTSKLEAHLGGALPNWRLGLGEYLAQLKA